MAKIIKDLGLSVLLLVILSLLLFFQKEPVNWKYTYATGDKNPYGTYILAKQAKEVFPNKQFYESRIGIYQLIKNKFDGNIFIVADNLRMNEEDLEAIDEFCDNGNTVTVFAKNFDNIVENHWDLQVKTDQYFYDFETFIIETDTKKETLILNNKSYQIFSSTKLPRFDSLKTSYKVLATDENKNPLIIEKSIGDGKLILGLTPQVFTNLYLLDGNNYQIAEYLLNLHPVKNTRFVTFYHLGRLPFNAAAMLIFNNPGYKTAFYLLAILTLLYFLFKSKRLERPIPVLKAPSNASLEFSNMLGILFYQQKQYKKAGSMLIRQINNYLFHQYNLRGVSFRDDEIPSLIQRTGKTEAQIRKLFKEINFINSQTQINATQLYQLYMAYYKFKHDAS